MVTRPRSGAARPGASTPPIAHIAYTAGVLFYAIDRIPYNHAIWHLFVIAGSVCHYLAVLWYVVPIPAAG